MGTNASTSAMRAARRHATAAGPVREPQRRAADQQEDGDSDGVGDAQVGGILKSFSALVWKYFFLSAGVMGSWSDTVTSDGTNWYG